MLLRDVDALYENALVGEHLQHRSTPASVLPGYDDDFIALLDLVHLLFSSCRSA